MSFVQYSPVVAKHLQNLIKAERTAAEADGVRWKAQQVFNESVVSHLGAQGLAVGRKVWHVQRDGEIVQRKITMVQVVHGFPTDSSWEVAVHMEHPSNEFGVVASLANVHRRKGVYQYIPRPKS